MKSFYSYHWVVFIFISLVTLDRISTAADIRPTSAAEGGKNGNPGVKIRLTRNGLNYLNQIVRQQMSIIIPRIRIDDMTNTRGPLTITLTEGRVTHYKPPDTQSMNFQSPDLIILTMKNMDVSVRGHVLVNSRMLNKDSDFDAKAEQIDVTYAIKVFKQSSGHIGLKIQDCRATVGQSNLDLSNIGSGGGAGSQIMDNIFRRRLERRICDRGSHYFENSVNKQLASRPTKIWLNGTAGDANNNSPSPQNGQHQQQNSGTSNSDANNSNNNEEAETNSRRDDRKERREQRKEDRGRGGGRGKKRAADPAVGSPAGSPDDKTTIKDSPAVKNITKHLMLDYATLKDPKVFEDSYLESYHKGEISYHGQGGGTPFNPPDIHEPSNPYPSDRMLYVLISDYVPNSMLYQAYVHELLKYHLTAADAPNLAPYLKTTCGDGSANVLFDVCLGTLIPQIPQSFPDSQVLVYLEASKSAPVVIFENSDGGGEGLARILGSVTITMHAKSNKGNDPPKLMGVAEADVKAKAKLRVESQTIKGNVTVDDVQMKMKTNNIKGFGAEELSSLKALVRTLMEMTGNSYLRKGLPLPLINGMKLTKTTMNIYERTIRVDSDFEIDNTVLTKMIAKGISENSRGVRVDGAA